MSDSYVGYMRRSTSRQELSFEAQEQAIRRACRERGWRLAGIESDAMSGKTAERPGLALALGRCEDGSVAGIVVAKLDRLTRSVVDLGKLLDRAKRGRFNIVALDFGLDLSTPQGELVANVLASVAQWERRIIGQRTSEALRQLPRERRNGRPVFDDAVRSRAKLLRSHGLTLHAIARRLEDEGVQPARGGSRLYPTTVARMLAD